MVEMSEVSSPTPDIMSEKATSIIISEKSHTSRRNSSVSSIVDRLRHLSAQGADRPQVVVVGDISCGKTSLIESLTGFSIDTAVVPKTRFPTEISLQRTTLTEGSSVRVCLDPGEHTLQLDNSQEIIDQIAALEITPIFEKNDLSEIVDKVAMHLGLPNSESADDALFEHNFSDDVLRIQIRTPYVEDLHIVDLPGVAHNATSSQSQEEMDMLKAKISEYVAKPHNIILALMAATNSISNQEAFQVAKMVDPFGIRTVGVITKCDAVPADDLDSVLELASNEIEPLHHGWFVVKNRSRSQAKKGLSARKIRKLERRFFGEEPWTTLSVDRVGSQALSRFLSSLLYSLMRRDFIGLLQEVQVLAEEPEEVAESLSVGIYDEKNPKAVSVMHTEITETDITGDEEEEEEEEDPDEVDIEAAKGKKRPTNLWNAIMVAFTLALVLFLMGLGFRSVTTEIRYDGNYWRLLFVLVVPPQIFISLFFCQTIVCDIAQLIGPVNHMRQNSKYFSAIRPPRLHIKNGPLPHMTIQCPVYKEGLEGVIKPTVNSLNAAIKAYEKRGGTVTMFFNDDGMQLISKEDADARRAYYIENKIGWVARPKHNSNPAEGELKFIRKGKFKKASNMNYALMISLRVEDKLLLVERHEGWTQRDEDAAYQTCLQEVLDEEEGRAWADGNIRIGDYILLIDSDTRVPVNCLIDAASEMELEPRVGIIQFSSGVMQVTTSFFENGITWFTNLIYTAIRFAVSSGDVSPFVGHNACLRWSALQETSFYDYDSGPSGNEKSYEKFWSESHVSEDFDMALRLQTQGYIVRMGAYTGEGFKEGVSLTVYDELARWEKYAYGCNELVFHPLKLWLWRGPFTPLFRKFIFSNMPLGSKFTILAYIGTYYAIGYTWIGALLNYFLVGWINDSLDHFYVDSFRVYFAIIVVFTLSGNVALAVIRYRSEGKSIISCMLENLKWVPMMSIFLGGLSLHVSQALLSHMLGIDMIWGATSKESEETSFFIELPMILSRFKWTFLFTIVASIMMVTGATCWPALWRIDFFTAIWPLASVVGNHFLLPVLLNPALMMFTW